MLLKELQFAGESICGAVRKRNEDQFFLASRPQYPSIAVVADGIGGHRDGDVASFFCARKLLTAWQRRAKNITDSTLAKSFWDREIASVNAELYQSNMQRNNNNLAMGTTVVGAMFLGDSVVVAHAGDSRMYSCSAEKGLIQHTIDHTLLQKMQHCDIELYKDFSPEMLENIISRSIGTRPQVELDFNIVKREPATKYLLCSDGLSKYVDAAFIEQTLKNATSPRTAVNQLMRQSLISGSSDNITIIVIFED